MIELPKNSHLKSNFKKLGLDITVVENTKNLLKIVINNKYTPITEQIKKGLEDGTISQENLENSKNAYKYK